MNGPVRPWSSKPRQRDLTPMLRRPVEPAMPGLSAAVNVVASVFFISMLGLTGAAIATTIVLIVWKVATAFFIARHLRLLPGTLGMFGSTLRRSLGFRL